MALKCSSLNVDKYFERIGYTDSREPTLATLNKLCWCHVTSIPHDTLDILAGRRKVLDLDKIYHDLVERRRGGFCYEQNGLLGSVLEALGYKLSLLEGSCFMDSKDVFSNPYDHLLLKVEIEGCDWIVDVGYGAPSFFEPIKFELMKQQTQMTGIYRFRSPIKNTFYCERRKRKVINGNTGEQVNDEIKASNHRISDDWELIFKFTGSSCQWKDYVEACEAHQTTKDGFYTNNSFLQIFHSNSFYVLWGTKLLEMEFKDPLTQVITTTEIMPGSDSSNPSEEDRKIMVEFMKARFGVETDCWPVFMSRDHHPL